MPRRRMKEMSLMSSSSSSSSNIHQQRPSSCTSTSSTKEKPQQRNAANARERARMRVLSRAFCRLKTTLPWVPADTKLSKLDTLRLATTYIGHLRAVLVDETSSGSSTTSPLPSSHPLSMSWPFMFNSKAASCGGPSSSPLSDGSESSSSSTDQYHFQDFHHAEHNIQHHSLPDVESMNAPQQHQQQHHNIYSNIPMELNYSGQMMELQ